MVYSFYRTKNKELKMKENEVKRIENMCRLSKIEWLYRSSERTITEIMYTGKLPLYFNKGFKISKGLFDQELTGIFSSENKTVTQIKTFETKNGSIELHYHDYNPSPMYYIFRYINTDGVTVIEKGFVTE